VFLLVVDKINICLIIPSIVKLFNPIINSSVDGKGTTIASSEIAADLPSTVVSNTPT